MCGSPARTDELTDMLTKFGTQTWNVPLRCHQSQATHGMLASRMCCRVRQRQRNALVHHEAGAFWVAIRRVRVHVKGLREVHDLRNALQADVPQQLVVLQLPSHDGQPVSVGESNHINKSNKDTQSANPCLRRRQL